jgi:protein-disulfide isomerase
METLPTSRRPGSMPLTDIRARVLLCCLLLTTGVVGCSGQKSVAQQARPTSGSSAGARLPEVLASIGTETITMADIRALVGDDLDQMETRYRRAQYMLIDTALQSILRERVLLAESKKQGKTVDQLIAAAAGGSLEPTDVEIRAWYEENRSRLGGRSLDQLRPQITDYLRSERRKQSAQLLEQRLDQEYKVTVNLEPFRVDLDSDGGPTLGPGNAPITLVEFSDFQCPFCERFFPTLKRLEQNFGTTLRVVYRQFPISNIHPDAFKAAEASLCAYDQGKFWEMHDLLFQEQDRLTVKDLKVKADRLGLNQRKFDACLDSGRHVEQVQDDLRKGRRIGVTGTPAIFVNGIPVEGGAVAYDVIAAVIKEELARGQSVAPDRQDSSTSSNSLSGIRCTNHLSGGRQCIVANVTPSSAPNARPTSFAGTLR